MSFKDYINNYDLYEWINHYSPYELENQYWIVASIFYKLNKNKYSFKNYKPEIWIYKNDTSVNTAVVRENLIVDVKLVEYILIDFLNTIDYNSLQYKRINHIIKMFESNKFIENVINDIKELFYDN